MVRFSKKRRKREARDVESVPFESYRSQKTDARPDAGQTSIIWKGWDSSFGAGALRLLAPFESRFLPKETNNRPDRAGTAVRFCGKGGIRTHETLSGLPLFESGAFDHSATFPFPAWFFPGNRPKKVRRNPFPVPIFPKIVASDAPPTFFPSPDVVLYLQYSGKYLVK